MIGIVVVTHGRLAEEFVAAAEEQAKDPLANFARHAGPVVGNADDDAAIVFQSHADLDPRRLSAIFYGVVQ